VVETHVSRQGVEGGSFFITVSLERHGEKTISREREEKNERIAESPTSMAL